MGFVFLGKLTMLPRPPNCMERGHSSHFLPHSASLAPQFGMQGQCPMQYFHPEPPVAFTPSLARVILRRRKFDDITPSLMELQWLSMQQKVHLRLATISFNTIHTKEPEYLYDLLKLHEPVRTLRSSNSRLLSSSRTRTVISSLAFKHSSVFIWNNNLPADIRNCDSLYTFRRRLKTLCLTLYLPPRCSPTPTNSLTTYGVYLSFACDYVM